MKKPTTAAEAHALKLKAERIRMDVQRSPDYNPEINRMDMAQANTFDAAAVEFLTLREPPARGTGGELTPPRSTGKIGMEFAVKEPDYVSLTASIERVELADKCGAFNLALDAAETVKATDATEQMLAHQMAAAHKAALDLLAKSATQRDTIEQARLANTAARLMDTYQRAMLTLNRIRSGGRQLVTVQHVQVADGGQAVITGSVSTGGQSTGGEGEK